jgi:hypothetical protein
MVKSLTLIKPRFRKRTPAVASELSRGPQQLRYLARALLTMRADPHLLQHRDVLRVAVRRFADVINQVAEREDRLRTRDDDLAEATWH